MKQQVQQPAPAESVEATSFLAQADAVATQFADVVESILEEVIGPDSVDEQTKPVKLREFYAHRSGHETHQYCPRKRFLTYHHLGTGVNLFPPIYFDIGTAVHLGLGHLLQFGTLPDSFNIMLRAVDVALEYFSNTPVYATLNPFGQQEQETLIAGLLWAFYYRAWPGFIKQFKVLFVEHPSDDPIEFTLSSGAPAILHLLSRPDAIVQDRVSGEVVAINWKTINDLNDERRENITNSLQVNLEAYYAERLYAKYLENEYTPQIPAGLRGKALMDWLDSDLKRYKAMAPTVAYTQIVYLVKGARVATLANGQEIPNEVEGDYLDAEKVWRQNSPLCYRYVNLGDSGPKGRSRKSLEEFPETAWTTRYWKEGNVSYNQLGKDYVKQPVWESGVDISQYVQLLNSGEVFPSNLRDDRNAHNPLNKIVVFEAPIYRDAGRQARFLRQVMLKEMEIADKLETGPPKEDPNFSKTSYPLFNANQYEEWLDENFPQHIISCRKPVRCEFDKICNPPSVEEPGKTQLVAELVQITPGGIWQRREPHHEAERVAFANNEAGA